MGEHQRKLERRNCFWCPGVPTQPASRKRCSTPPVLMPSKNVWLESKNIFRPPMSQKPLPSKLRKNCVLLIVSKDSLDSINKGSNRNSRPASAFLFFFSIKPKPPRQKYSLIHLFFCKIWMEEAIKFDVFRTK